jgi:hypothetical protein
LKKARRSITSGICADTPVSIMGVNSPNNLASKLTTEPGKQSALTVS